MKNTLKPTLNQLIDLQLDITEPQLPVEVLTDDKGVLWVNVGPVCVVRICRIQHLSVNGKHLATKVPGLVPLTEAEMFSTAQAGL